MSALTIEHRLNHLHRRQCLAPGNLDGNINLALEKAINIARRHGAIIGQFGNGGFGIAIMAETLSRRVNYLFAFEV